MCHCVGFFSSSLQKLLRLIGFPSQTQGRSQKCYLWVSHHIKGMSGYYSSHECVADICCFLWQLPSCNCPFSDSRKTERKCETGRNNEAWVQSPQQAFGFSVTNMSFDDNIIVHLTHVVGACCLMGWIKVWRTSEAQHKWKRNCRMHFTGFAPCFLNMFLSDFLKFNSYFHSPVSLV